MNNDASLPQTQAATLTKLREIGEIEPGVQTPGINLNAIGPLVRKGFAEFVQTESGTKIRPVTA